MALRVKSKVDPLLIKKRSKNTINQIKIINDDMTFVKSKIYDSIERTVDNLKKAFEVKEEL